MNDQVTAIRTVRADITTLAVDAVVRVAEYGGAPCYSRLLWLAIPHLQRPQECPTEISYCMPEAARAIELALAGGGVDGPLAAFAFEVNEAFQYH
jgi:hypothetical protein